MNYYKVKFSDKWIDDNGNHVCTIDYKKARKDLSDKNKNLSATLYETIIYSLCIAFDDISSNIKKPKHFKTDLCDEELYRELNKINEEILSEILNIFPKNT